MAKKQKVETEDQGVKPEAVHVGGESLADRIVPHLKKIFVSVLVITVILVGYFMYRWWKHSGLEKDTHALSSSLDVLRTDVVIPPAEGSGSGGGSGSGSDTVTPTPPTGTQTTFASYQQRAERGLEKLSGPVGNVFRANLLFDAGRLDDAEKAYQRSAGRKDLEGVLAREGLGFVAEQRAHVSTDAAARDKLLNDALTRFQQITATDDVPHAEYRHYHAGRILVQLQKLDEADAAFEKAQQIAPDSELAPLIEMRLAQIEAMK